MFVCVPTMLSPCRSKGNKQAASSAARVGRSGIARQYTAWYLHARFGGGCSHSPQGDTGILPMPCHSFLIPHPVDG